MSDVGATNTVQKLIYSQDLINVEMSKENSESSTSIRSNKSSTSGRVHETPKHSVKDTVNQFGEFFPSFYSCMFRLELSLYD